MLRFAKCITVRPQRKRAIPTTFTGGGDQEKVNLLFKLIYCSTKKRMIIRNQPTGFCCRYDAQNPMCRRRKLS